MFNTASYDDQVERIGRIGAFAPGSYINACRTCGAHFLGDKRAHQCLACTVTAMAQSLARYDALLRQHHEWHQQEGLEMKLGDEYFDAASCYVDSTLEEETTSALGNTVIHMPPSTHE